MLKVYSILYRVAIIIVFGLYILMMLAVSSGGYGNSDPNTVEITYLVLMAAVFVTLTLFSNVKDNKAKNIYRYVSLALVAILIISFGVVIIMTELSTEVLFIFVLFGTISSLLGYELIRYKTPQ